MKKILAFSLVVVLSALSLGCGKKMPEGMPNLEPVKLTVTQDGAPCADAQVNLQSLDPSNQWTSGGVTDAQGVVALVTHGQYKGVPIGKYKVSVFKKVGEGTPPPPLPTDEASEKAYNDYYESGQTYDLFCLIEKQYTDLNTTPLEIEVVKGKNELAVDVGAPVHDVYIEER
ncbi:MAG: carboxypeptidase regulatory-like domain-containing protein [Thermoguttaceae bacterium]|nr:carboxypeptidase regulatory-like domain-containing protein [Thermoguttaceae bacterium]